MLKLALFPVWLVWCLPQNLAGLAVFAFEKCRHRCIRKETDGIVYFEVRGSRSAFGVSLGFWIFIGGQHNGDVQYNDDGQCRGERITVHHEYGHQIQSLILGPLYLLVIGLPSGLSNVPWVSRVIFGREHHTVFQYYHDFPWERGADKLGGIKHEFPREGCLKRSFSG